MSSNWMKMKHHHPDFRYSKIGIILKQPEAPIIAYIFAPVHNACLTIAERAQQREQRWQELSQQLPDTNQMHPRTRLVPK